MTLLTILLVIRQPDVPIKALLDKTIIQKQIMAFQKHQKKSMKKTANEA